MSLNFKTSCCNLKTRGLGRKLCLAFYYFCFERNYDVLNSKEPIRLKSIKPILFVLLNKNIKTRRNRKWKMPQTVLELWTLCVGSYKNHYFKEKLWWVGAREIKQSVFFCVSSQCVVYWINFHNVCTFAYLISLLPIRLLLVFEVVESLQCILKGRSAWEIISYHIIELLQTHNINFRNCWGQVLTGASA